MDDELLVQVAATLEVSPDTIKNIVAISAIKQSKPQVDSNDVSPAINFDLIGHDDFAKEADSVGKAFYQSILPPTVYREEGLKAVLNRTLLYYKSKGSIGSLSPLINAIKRFKREIRKTINVATYTTYTSCKAALQEV